MVNEREPRDIDEAGKYFEDLFFRTGELISTVCESWEENRKKTNPDLPFDVVRVLGQDERSALMSALQEQVEMSLFTVYTRSQMFGGISEEELMTMVISQMFLGFCVGYRHAIEEIAITT